MPPEPPCEYVMGKGSTHWACGQPKAAHIHTLANYLWGGKEGQYHEFQPPKESATP